MKFNHWITVVDGLSCSCSAEKGFPFDSFVALQHWPHQLQAGRAPITIYRASLLCIIYKMEHWEEIMFWMWHHKTEMWVWHQPLTSVQCFASWLVKPELVETICMARFLRVYSWGEECGVRRRWGAYWPQEPFCFPDGMLDQLSNIKPKWSGLTNILQTWTL